MAERSALAILRRTQVEQETGLAKSTLYLRVEQGLFTEPVLIGPRAVGWPAGEVEALNRARIAGMDDAGIQRLVKSLEAARRSAGTPSAVEPATHEARP
jgi:prophage regulatory protein